MARREAGSGVAPNLVVGALLAVVLAAALLALPGTLPGTGSGDASAANLRALLHDSEGVVHELALSEDAELAVVTDLGTNVVVVQDGSVFVREADCDGLDCVHQGRLSTPGGQIICLPHRLWIEVVADGDAGGQMDVDAVAALGDDSERLDAIAR